MSLPVISPCPFCGSLQVSCIGIDIDEWSVTCESCKANGPSKPEAATAIVSWNSVIPKPVSKDEHAGLLQRIIQKVA